MKNEGALYSPAQHRFFYACPEQGSNYYYLYYIRACAPTKTKLLELKSNKKLLNGITEAPQEGTFSMTLALERRKKFTEQPVSECKNGDYCGEKCWKSICRDCLVAYNGAHCEAYKFLLMGSVARSLMPSRRRCPWLPASPTDHPCTDAIMPTCGGYCYQHRRCGVTPPAKDVVLRELSADAHLRHVPAAVLGLIADWAQ